MEIYWCINCESAFKNEEPICTKCKSKNVVYTSDSEITIGDLLDLKSVTTDKNFFRSMIELREKDPIEYQLKMSQFKANASQSKQESNKTKCPKCGSTNIQMVNRKWSVLTGFMTNKTDRVCVNCKHKW